MAQAEAGKGSRARPMSVSQEEYESRWDAIFNRDKDTESADQQQSSESTTSTTEVK